MLRDLHVSNSASVKGFSKYLKLSFFLEDALMLLVRNENVLLSSTYFLERAEKIYTILYSIY